MKRRMQRGWAACAVGLVAVVAGAAGAGAQEPAATPAAQPGKPLATEEHEVGEVEVTLLELKRTSGNTVTMKWQYENKSNEVKPLFSRSGVYPQDPYMLAVEAYIVDPANKKKYLVIEDAKGVPVAAKHKEGKDADIEVEPGKTLKTWAKYPAPPASVDKVTVYIAGIAPLEDVPLAP
ncbi:MAG: hypothetical protein AB1689_00410 [Thermodesulfobacteriota bacterium]